MDITRRHTLTVTGATLALLMAGTAVVSANGGQDDRGGPGFGGDRHGGSMRGDLGPGVPGFGGRLGPGLGLGMDGLVRNETTLDLGEAGFLTRRVDDGTITSASDTELTYTLATGESATVTTDEDTEVLAVTQDTESDTGVLRRRQMSLDEIALADIPADADVVVWSEAGEDGAFVAQRVIVRPVEDAATQASDDAAASDSSATEAAPSASPAV